MKVVIIIILIVVLVNTYILANLSKTNVSCESFKCNPILWNPPGCDCQTDSDCTIGQRCCVDKCQYEQERCIY
jgi:hypothetical protein